MALFPIRAQGSNSGNIFYSPNSNKSVGDPSDKYQSVRILWDRARAIIGGQRFTKEYDFLVDTVNFNNLLLPFSHSMTQRQYDFFRAEAELPGFTSQYARTVIGSLLRKGVSLELPLDAPPEAEEWLRNEFTSDGSSIISFLDDCLWEEIQTSRCWVMVDYPVVNRELTVEESNKIQPYPTILKAENIINWHTGKHPITQETCLTMLITRQYVNDYSENNFHPNYNDLVTVYRINDAGYVTVDMYERIEEDDLVPIINGEIQHYYDIVGGGYKNSGGDSNFKFVRSVSQILMNGTPMTKIPAFPLNGSIDVVEPILQPLIDREVGLYNKVSRRNHLLYGAATYTPVVSSDMTDDEFDTLVSAGLGSWLKVREGESITPLATPTDALADMETSISNTIEEMARLGIRLLDPDGNNNTSGVALEIRNAAQTGQLGHLNTRISETMRKIITLMLNWRYDTSYETTDIGFMLSGDFNPAPLGADWMRLVTEWYQAGLIPRTLWLEISKQNDIVPNSYNDLDAMAEIEEDTRIVPVREQFDTEQEFKQDEIDLREEALSKQTSGTGPGSGRNPSSLSALGQRGLGANRPLRERIKSANDGSGTQER